MPGAEKQKLTIQIPEGVDVDIVSVSGPFNPGTVDEVVPPPTGYTRAYRWNAAAVKTKLTIQIPEGVDVDTESVPREFEPHAVQEVEPPAGYRRAYRWNAAG
jgi:hypothetical protein